MKSAREEVEHAFTMVKHLRRSPEMREGVAERLKAKAAELNQRMAEFGGDPIGEVYAQAAQQVLAIRV